jgi:secreted trypsin-like serine protease
MSIHFTRPNANEEEYMKKTKTLIFLVVFVLMLVSAMPVGAVTDGQPDGNGHPFVGLMVAKDAAGNPLWRCSGTLLSSTVFLTAGHCTEAPAVSATIWFEADVQALGYDLSNPNMYPNGGPTTVNGITHTHPLFSFPRYDVGVVVLDKPMKMKKYGVLPSLNQLDVLKTERGLQDVTFTAVGYGMQKSFPDAAAWKNISLKVRMVAYPHLLQINVPGFTGDFSMLLSNNANTGGTCFGDSGGPNFLGSSNVVAGVTSFGINGNCAGTGGVYRMDRQTALDFVNKYLNP